MLLSSHVGESPWAILSASAVWDTDVRFEIRMVQRRATLEKKCPRRPAATITTLTAATGKVLTEFVGFRPTDLGHRKVRMPRTERQRLVAEKSRSYADFRPIHSLCPGTFHMFDLDAPGPVRKD